MTSGESRLRVRTHEPGPSAGSGSITIVEFVDRNILDEANILQIADEIGALVARESSPRLLISFAGVEHLSSAALGALITINNQIKERDGQLRLAEINDQIIEVFRITRLDRLFQIHPSADEALRSFR
jgi:anti-sigma B factor antagonist